MGFFSSVGSALASMGSALTGSSSTLSLGDLTGGWVNYSSGQSKLKDAYKRAINASQTLATQSPSWTVQGLRNAGLNPILALQDGSITAAHGVNPAMATGDGGSSSFSFSKKAKSEQQLLESQVDNAKANAANLAANSAKIRNDIKNDNVRTASDVAVNNAKINQLQVQTANEYDTGGLGGWSGFTAGALNRAGGVLNGKSNPYDKHSSKDVYSSFDRSASSLSNSASDYSKGKSVLLRERELDDNTKLKAHREGYMLHMR